MLRIRKTILPCTTALLLINSLVPRSAVEVCEAVSEGRTVVLVEGEGRASSILVASLGRERD
jgi:hypothetical protein